MSDVFLTVLLTLDATFRVSTPLIIAAMAGLFAERAGVVDIGLEGKMLAAAFAAASVSAVVGSPWAGLGCGYACVLWLGHVAWFCHHYPSG